MSRAVPPAQPSLDTFGSPKQNYGVVKDPSRAHTAEDINAGAATMTALAFASARAWASVSAAGALIAYGSNWGDSAGAYAPVSAKTGTGGYTVTWPANVPNLYDGAMVAFAPRATNVGVNTSGRVGNSRHSGQVVTVETYNVAGGAAADAAFTVLVF